MAGLLIGELARRAGVTAPAIRYYEQIGLLPSAQRSATGYRRYSDTALEELQFIRKAQGLGFSLEEIGQILQLSRSGQGPCAHVLSLAHQHLAAVDERIKRLQKFRTQLAADVAKWDKKKTATTCRGMCQFINDADPDNTAEAVPIRRARENP